MYEIGLEEGMWLIGPSVSPAERRAHGVGAGLLTASRRLLFLGNLYSKGFGFVAEGLSVAAQCGKVYFLFGNCYAK